MESYRVLLANIISDLAFCVYQRKALLCYRKRPIFIKRGHKNGHILMAANRTPIS
jgi:hypothetical protein